MHEGQVVHNRLAHPNNANNTAPPNRKRRRANTALHPRTLQHSRRRLILVPFRPKTLPDLLRVPFRSQSGLDLVRLTPRHELLRECQPLGLQVGDHDGVSARGAGAGEGDEADGTGAADEGRAAEGEASCSDAVEDHAEGLEEGGFFVGDVVGDPGAR